MGSVEFTVNDPENPGACGVLTVTRELLDDPGVDAAGYVGLRLMRVHQGKIGHHEDGSPILGFAHDG